LDKVQFLARLMKDENFRTFLANPKVREVFLDPEFQRAVKTQDMGQVMTNPKFAVLMQDPDIARLIITLKASFFEK